MEKILEVNYAIGKKIKIAFTIILFIFLVIYYYLFHVSLNPTNIESLIFLISVFGIFTFYLWIVLKESNIKNKILSGLGILLGLSVIYGIGGFFFSSKIFHAKVYANRVNVEKVKFDNQTLPEVDFNQTPIIDRASTIKLGDKVMGNIPELVSQFEVSNEYTQISYKNSVYRVTPLEYPGFIKWLGNKKSGIPAYIKVNSSNGQTELVKLKDLGLGGMKYVPSAYFNYNLNRKLQFDYPTSIFGKPSFEIDEKGHPYYVCTTYGYYGVGQKKYVNGMVLFDPITGNSTKYEVGHFPKWVDRVYPEDLVMQEIDDNGSLQDGYINTLLSQKNVTYTSDGYNYLEKNGDIWIYSGITSANNDASNLGFVLTNLRTHQTQKFVVSSANEEAAMDSAEGEVKNYGYKATFPLLVNVSGNPVYLLSLKDNGGLVKQYAMVDAKDYQKVSVISADSYNNLNKLKKLYNQNLDIQTTSKLSKTITINDIRYLTYDNQTRVYIIDEKKNKYRFDLSSNNEEVAAYLEKGDKITITYEAGTINNIDTINK